MDSPGVVTDMMLRKALLGTKLVVPATQGPSKECSLSLCTKLNISPIGPGTTKLCELAIGTKPKPDDRLQPPVTSLT